VCDSDSKFDAGDEVGKGLEAEFTVEAILGARISVLVALLSHLMELLMWLDQSFTL
jgi:hypothetical protein